MKNSNEKEKPQWRRLPAAEKGKMVAVAAIPYQVVGKPFRAVDIANDLQRIYKSEYRFNSNTAVVVVRHLEKMGFKHLGHGQWEYAGPNHTNARQLREMAPDQRDAVLARAADAALEEYNTPHLKKWVEGGSLDAPKSPHDLALSRLEDYLMEKSQEARIHQNEKDELENYYKGRKVMAKEAANMLRHFRRLELKLAEGGNHS